VMVNHQVCRGLVPSPPTRMSSAKHNLWWLAILDKVHPCYLGLMISCPRRLLQTNFTVPVLTAVYLLYTRSAAVAYFGAGVVACSLSAKLVKKVIRQPRPNHPGQRKISYGYGQSISPGPSPG